MANMQFNHLLIDRRRSLGLSLRQAAYALRLKESALVAFEEADFANIPKGGYAHGMLSSYARYLGLNPGQIINLYEENLYEFTHGGLSSHELRRKNRAFRSQHGAAEGGLAKKISSLGSKARSDRGVPQYRRLLQQDNPRLGDEPSFSTTSIAHSRSDTRVQYRQTPGDETRQLNQADLKRAFEAAAYAGYDRGFAKDRSGAALARETARFVSSRYGAAGQQNPSRAGRSRFSSAKRQTVAPSIPGAQNIQLRASAARRDTIFRQQFNTDAYVDDLNFDANASQFDVASSEVGRRRSRNIASRVRPRVERKDRGGAPGRGRGARRVPVRRPGFAGFIQFWTEDPKRLLFALGLGLALVLIIIVIGAIRSCTAPVPQTQQTVPVSTATATPAQKAQTTQQNQAASGTNSAALTSINTSANTTGNSQSLGGAAGTSSDSAPAPVNVKVSVAAGQVSWVEIRLDGKSVVAKSITGPWEQSFSPQKQFFIQADNTKAVNVTKNNQNVPFNSYASGLGSITIEGSDPDGKYAAKLKKEKEEAQKKAQQKSGSAQNASSQASNNGSQSSQNSQQGSSQGSNQGSGQNSDQDSSQNTQQNQGSAQDQNSNDNDSQN